MGLRLCDRDCWATEGEVEALRGWTSRCGALSLPHLCLIHLSPMGDKEPQILPPVHKSLPGIALLALQERHSGSRTQVCSGQAEGDCLVGPLPCPSHPSLYPCWAGHAHSHLHLPASTSSGRDHHTVLWKEGLHAGYVLAYHPHLPLEHVSQALDLTSTSSPHQLHSRDKACFQISSRDTSRDSCTCTEQGARR